MGPEVGPGQVGSQDHDPWDDPAIPMGRDKNCWVLLQLSPEAFGNSGDQYLFSLNLGMFSQLVHSVAQRAKSLFNVTLSWFVVALWWRQRGWSWWIWLQEHYRQGPSKVGKGGREA